MDQVILEPKTCRCCSRSLKFEFRLHSPGSERSSAKSASGEILSSSCARRASSHGVINGSRVAWWRNVCWGVFNALENWIARSCDQARARCYAESGGAFKLRRSHHACVRFSLARAAAARRFCVWQIPQLQNFVPNPRDWFSVTIILTSAQPRQEGVMHGWLEPRWNIRIESKLA